MNPLLLQLYARYGIDPTEANRDALKAAAAKEAVAVRAVRIEPATIDREARSVEAVIATEDPVEVWDWERWEVVDEVLLMAGCRLNEVRKGKLPLLDCHQRTTARNVLGSVVDLRTEGGRFIGREVFSVLSEPEFVKTTEGHLDQRSVGYRIYAATYIKPGETGSVNGRTFSAKANRGLSVVTDWSPLEDSVVPIGADPAAGTRAAAKPQPVKPTRTSQENHPAMNPKLRALLVTLGMPADATEDQASEYLAKPETQEALAARSANPPPATPVQQSSGAPAQPAAAVTRSEFDELRQQIAATQLREQVEGVFRPFGHLEGIDALRAKCIDDKLSVDQARAKLVEHLQKATPAAGRAVITKDEADKRRECAVQAVYLRANPAAKVTDEERKQAAQFRGMSLFDLARHCLEANGVSTRGMDKMTLVAHAFTTRSFAATGDFPYILSSTANKALMAAYTLAPQPWRMWCKRGSLSDFKATPRVRLSEAGVLTEVPEGAEFPNASFSDSGENIQLATFGRIFAITRQAIINDDLDAFSAVPTRHARAWARTINQVAVTVPLANGTLADTGALYNATAVTTAGGHANYDTSTTTVTTQATAEAVIRSLKAKIAAQKDLDAESYLQLRIRYLLTGPTLAPYYTQALYETLRGGSERQVDIARMNLELIEEPEVENTALTGGASNSTYAFCDPADAPAVEVAFLDGNDAPRLEEETAFSVDGVRYKVAGDVGAKAIDWRPTAKHVN